MIKKMNIPSALINDHWPVLCRTDLLI
uniref:Uncharacterized protein n=1 Tax=Anguilla anguilla TaxID=7936 RepID=A0A0E9P583_ANGAN